MDYIKLRPHHFLCIRFWQGKGYSPAFTKKMESIIPLLKNDCRIQITAGPDDLCACCPNMTGQEGSPACRTQEKVARYDEAVLKNCRLTEGQMTTWNALYDRVTDAFFKPDADGSTLFARTCGDCSWFSVCAEAAGKKK